MRKHTIADLRRCLSQPPMQLTTWSLSGLRRKEKGTAEGPSVERHSQNLGRYGQKWPLPNYRVPWLKTPNIFERQKERDKSLCLWIIYNRDSVTADGPRKPWRGGKEGHMETEKRRTTGFSYPTLPKPQQSPWVHIDVEAPIGPGSV